MECQRCQRPLTDARICNKCGWRQSVVVAKAELAVERLPIREKRDVVPPAQPEKVVPKEEPVASVSPTRDVAAERLERKRAAAAKKAAAAPAQSAQPVDDVAQHAAPAVAAPVVSPEDPPLGEKCPPETPVAATPVEEPPPIMPEPPDARTAADPEPEPEPEPTKRPQPGPAAPPPPPPNEADFGGTQFSHSKLNDFNAIHGNHNILYNQHFSFRGEAETAFEFGPTIFEILTDLPPAQTTDPTAAAFLPEELRSKTNSLRRDRLLLISCDDAGFLRAAARALADNIGTAGQQKLLNFRRLPSTSFVPTLSHFLMKRAADEEMVVVVDAMTAKAQEFVDSLFTCDGAMDSADIGQSLATQHLRLICVVDPLRIASRSQRELEEASFDCWSLSYLCFRLRDYFPDTYRELEAKLGQQRAAGRWARLDADFRKQVLELLEAGRLQEVIDAGGIPIEPPPDESFPRSSQPVHMLVSYVATFYPSLAPNEFRRVVESLLGDRTQLISATVEQKESDGTIKVVQVQREKRLLDLWREDSDAIVQQCRLGYTREANRVVAFVDTGSRDRFRREFEENYGLYIQSQFFTAYESGLLFDDSERIAANLRALTIEMVSSYPDQFGAQWLFGIIASASRPLGNSALQVEAAHVYQRITELLLDLSGHDLESMVKGVIEQLIASSMHATAFEILQHLRRRGSFDALSYIRQIVDRGKLADREAIAAYLSRELRRPGNPYGMLRALESWLPPIDRDPEKYSQANTLVLRLLLEYCVELTSNYELQQYGQWPTEFPLFNLLSEAKAREELALLARWLLHPGLRSVLEEPAPADHATRLVSALLCEWAFILIGVPNRSRTDHTDTTNASSAQQLSAESVFEILLDEVIACTAVTKQGELQRKMLDYWEELKAFLLFLANLPDETRRWRGEVLWKREAVRKLLTQFRRLQRDRRPPAPSPRASAIASA
jgi:hypothetical protein